MGKPDSNVLKGIALANLRFKKQCSIICSEGPCFNQDIIGLKDSSYEIEIKTSYSDFIADFKKEKHLYYANPDEAQLYNLFKSISYYKTANKYRLKSLKRKIIANLCYVPNYFSYFVPFDLADKIANYLVENNYTKYGVYTIKHLSCGIYADNMRVVKRAKKLHSNAIPEAFKADVLHRMSSELANFHINHRYLLEANNRVDYLCSKLSK